MLIYSRVERYRIQDTGYNIQDKGHGYRIKDTEHRKQDTRIPDTETGDRIQGYTNDIDTEHM